MKSKKSCSLVLLLCFSCFGFAQVSVNNLLVENLETPIGLDIATPRFSWQLSSTKRNVLQAAYQIRVGESSAGLSKKSALVWDSEKVNSDCSVFVEYMGPELKSGKKYYWQVRIWDQTGKVSGWSEPAFWQTAFFSEEDWTAEWIMVDTLNNAPSEACPVFRKDFSLLKKVESATLYITAKGLYEAKLNGKKIGDAFLTPGWTSYRKRLQYQAYDLTDQLSRGNNTLGVTLADGWFMGGLGAFENVDTDYGKSRALLLQMEIKYSDGTKENIISDQTWKSSNNSILSSGIYNGETVDYREEKAGWAMPGFDDSSWMGVMIDQGSIGDLLATYNEPIRKHEVFIPVEIFKTPRGEQVIDFGQNLVGFESIKISGKAGDTIRIQHAEILDEEGNFYTTNLRKAKSTNTFILAGTGEEVLEPRFTFHGFRYIKIEGIRGEINPEDFRAIALYSDMKPSGSFSCSNPLINQLQQNIQWGQKGNFLDIPTDCPQRDERLGWTGDAQAFSRTAAFNMDVHNFFVKWLKDLALDQYPSGSVPFVIPNVWREKESGSAGWADAATILPWNMYLAYGDKRVLEEQYSSMKAWVDYMKSRSKDNLWNTGAHFGDWLFYSPGPDDWGYAAVTDKYLIAQCFWAHSTQLLINAAEILGKNEDARDYSQLLKSVKEAFMNEYVTPNGRLLSVTQTAYVLALQFDMLPENLRIKTLDALVKNIEEYRFHLTTGFLGTPYLCHVLSRFGKTELAYRLLLQESYPSWLYPVTKGATTIWERWDGIKPDGSLQTPAMNSYNHYAYGAIGDWMYRVVAGIDTETEGPGYKKIRIHPHIEAGLTNASASFLSGYGKISSSWKIEGDQLFLDVEIPANTSATIIIPAKDSNLVYEGGIPVESAADFQVSGSDAGFVALKTGSGKYHFTVKQ